MLRLSLGVGIGNPPGPTSRHQGDSRTHRSCLYELASDLLKTQQGRQKCLHDRHGKESLFCPNDRVWLAMLRRGKLHRGWEGPYRVVEITGPQNKTPGNPLSILMKECGLPEAEPLAGRTISHLVPPAHPLRTSPESRCVDDGHPVTESSGRTILKEGGSLRRMVRIIPAHLTDFFVGQCTIGHAESQLLMWLLFRYLDCHCCIPLLCFCVYSEALIANSSKVSVQNRLLISIDLKE
ncbi:hypothetical protein T08_12126 [Trichinella sp. T8]|nr:hypothetical protein T08_12126 [Trichinella sp. T8]